MEQSKGVKVELLHLMRMRFSERNSLGVKVLDSVKSTFVSLHGSQRCFASKRTIDTNVNEFVIAYVNLGRQNTFS